MTSDVRNAAIPWQVTPLRGRRRAWTIFPARDELGRTGGHLLVSTTIPRNTDRGRRHPNHLHKRMRQASSGGGTRRATRSLAAGFIFPKKRARTRAASSAAVLSSDGGDRRQLPAELSRGNSPPQPVTRWPLSALRLGAGTVLARIISRGDSASPVATGVHATTGGTETEIVHDIDPSAGGGRGHT